MAYNGYDVVDGRIVVSQAPEATGKGACKAMGVNYDDCVLWAGCPSWARTAPCTARWATCLSTRDRRGALAHGDPGGPRPTRCSVFARSPGTSSAASSVESARRFP